MLKKNAVQNSASLCIRSLCFSSSDLRKGRELGAGVTLDLFSINGDIAGVNGAFR